MKYCQRCVMPISAVASSFNEKQICSACEYHDVYESLSTEQWLDRKKIFEKILNENKSNSNFHLISLIADLV